jgi:hypothetical protein
MNPLIQLQKAAPVFVVMLVCVGLLPKTQAVSPPPAGGYPNFTTAAGEHALQALTLGVGNTAIGTFRCLASPLAASIPLLALDRLILTPRIQIRPLALQRFLFNTTGTENTANGTAALEFNTTGDFNTANGAFALFNNTEGANNTAVGASALFSNTTGEFNNAVGFNALRSNVDGLFNNVMGFDAMAGNVAIGDSAGAGVNGDFNIYIGAFAGPASGSESETIRIGDVFNTACFIGGIRGQTASGGLAVFIGLQRYSAKVGFTVRQRPGHGFRSRPNSQQHSRGLSLPRLRDRCDMT